MTQKARMMKMNDPALPVSIQAGYKIITPMFIGDANQEASGISPQSFKGALRFWWRALAWGRIRQKHSSDEEALRELHKEEAILFGSSAYDPDTGKIYGKGKVAVKIEQPTGLAQKVINWPDNDSSKYLAYGLIGDRKNRPREALEENKSFTVTFLLATDIDSACIEQLNITLEALGLFGGLGSRTRRALGSIQLEMLDGQEYRIKNEKDYQEKAQKICSAFQGTQEAPFTAFSRKTRFSVAPKTSPSACDAHANMGEIYKNYRGQSSDLWGKSKTVFGLPLQGVDEKARRASPLFFHVIEYANGKFGYSVLYLPSSIFHPNKNHHENANYKLLEDFMSMAREQT